MIASPANPTGTMINASPAGRSGAVVRDRGVRLVSDEIYHGITDGDFARQLRLVP